MSVAAEREVIEGIVEHADLAPATTSEESQALSTREEVIYDADAMQRMIFQTEHRGKRYTVAHIFGPVRDAAVLEYERRRSQKLSDPDANESDDVDATAVTSKGFEAAVNYWNTNGTRAEGYGGKVKDRDKAFAVQNMLFGVEFDELPLASAEEVVPDEDDESSAYVLRCLFDGRECYTQAMLRPATSDEISEFEALMSRALLVKGTRFGERDQRIPARAKRLGEFFDSMKVSVEGYKGRVPLHHKTAFALRHLRAEQNIITGKQDASPR